MASAKDIVVWGASGYTGKLISESLHKLGLPFTAAGRNEDRLKKALEIAQARAAIGPIQAEIAVAEHTEASLTELFSGAKVVINVTGPFAQIGEVVVKAALAAGCHYLDTTGEQDFMLAMKRQYSDAFASKGRLLAPACSYMWSLGNLAAEVALENPAIDSVSLAYVSAQGAPSVASSQSFMRMMAAPHYYLKNNELTEWPIGATFDVVIPGYVEVLKGSSWGGAGEPVWYEDDARVKNCRVYNCADDGNLMVMIMDGVKQIVEGAAGNVEAREQIAVQAASSIVQEEPAKEDPSVQRGTIYCQAMGNVEHRACAINFHSPYVITGELIAICSQKLLNGEPAATGFSSAAKAFGHRELLSFLAEQGFVKVLEGEV